MLSKNSILLIVISIFLSESIAKREKDFDDYKCNCKFPLNIISIIDILILTKFI